MGAVGSQVANTCWSCKGDLATQLWSVEVSEEPRWRSTACRALCKAKWTRYTCFSWSLCFCTSSCLAKGKCPLLMKITASMQSRIICKLVTQSRLSMQEVCKCGNSNVWLDLLKHVIRRNAGHQQIKKVTIVCIHKEDPPPLKLQGFIKSIKTLRHDDGSTKLLDT